MEPETKELEKNEKEVKEEEVKVEEEKKEESKAENKEISEDEHSEEASAPESSDDDLPRRRTCHSDDEEEKPKKIYKKRLAEETKEKKEEKKPEEKNDEKEEPEKKKVEEKEEKDEHPEEEEKKVVEEENNVMDEAENEKKAEELEKKKSQSVLEKTKQREGRFLIHFSNSLHFAMLIFFASGGLPFWHVFHINTPGSDPWGIHEKHEVCFRALLRGKCWSLSGVSWIQYYICFPGHRFRSRPVQNGPTSVRFGSARSPREVLVVPIEIDRIVWWEIRPAVVYFLRVYFWEIIHFTMNFIWSARIMTDDFLEGKSDAIGQDLPLSLVPCQFSDIPANWRWINKSLRHSLTGLENLVECEHLSILRIQYLL